MSVFKLLFSFKGSISRLEYCAGLFGSIMIFAILLLLGTFINAAHSDNVTNLASIIKLVVAITYLCGIIMQLISLLALATKRLRNLQWSLWLLLLYIIPIISLVFVMIFIFRPGQPISKVLN